MRVADVGSARRRDFAGRLNATGEYFYTRSGTNMVVTKVEYLYDSSGQRAAFPQTSYPLGFTPVGSNNDGVNPWGCTNPYIVYFGELGTNLYHGLDCRDGSPIGSTIPNLSFFRPSLDRNKIYSVGVPTTFITPLTTGLSWYTHDLSSNTGFYSTPNFAPSLAANEVLALGGMMENGTDIGLHRRPAAGGTREIAAAEIRFDGTFSALSPYVNIGTANIYSGCRYDGKTRFFSLDSGSFALYESGSLTLTPTATLPGVLGVGIFHYDFRGHLYRDFQESGVRYGYGVDPLYVNGSVTTKPSGSFHDRDGYASLDTQTANGITSLIYTKHRIAGTNSETPVLSEAFGDVIGSFSPTEPTDLQGDTFSAIFTYQTYSEE